MESWYGTRSDCSGSPTNQVIKAQFAVIIQSTAAADMSLVMLTGFFRRSSTCN